MATKKTKTVEIIESADVSAPKKTKKNDPIVMSKKKILFVLKHLIMGMFSF